MTVPFPPSSFPVVFFDGGRDVDVGAVAVSPSLDFDTFLSSVSRKIGVSPGQISLSLIRRRKARSSPEVPRKVAIDESSDFAAISKERDCFVLAALRRPSRRGRGSRKKVTSATQEKKAMRILKRNQEYSIVGNWDYEDQMRNLEVMREKFLVGLTGGIGLGFGPPPAVISPARPLAICEECAVARREGKSPGFHRCVYDKVTFGFRSLAGPIERPTRKQVVEASAEEER